MKELLNTVRSQLQDDLNYVRDNDVFVTEDEHLLPETVRFPAVGLKDGPISRRELPGGMWEVTMSVDLLVYVQLMKDGATVMGDAAAGKKGVLEIEDDVHVSLDENLLSITGMQSAFSPNSGPSELFGEENEAVQRKKITYRYVKEEVRP